MGNGSIWPRLEDQPNVYRVTLTIVLCSGTYAHLNGEYAGLATVSPSDYWNYDLVLRMWLSTSDPEAPPATITMLAELL
jgi:hypothetical protein